MFPRQVKGNTVKKFTVVIAASVVVLLVACGGGGGSKAAHQAESGWTAAEEANFLHGTGQPGSKLRARARCILRNVEKAYPTYAQ
jgi:hypothetical protein